MLLHNANIGYCIRCLLHCCLSEGAVLQQHTDLRRPLTATLPLRKVHLSSAVSLHVHSANGAWLNLQPFVIISGPLTHAKKHLDKDLHGCCINMSTARALPDDGITQKHPALYENTSWDSSRTHVMCRGNEEDLLSYTPILDVPILMNSLAMCIRNRSAMII